MDLPRLVGLTERVSMTFSSTDSRLFMVLLRGGIKERGIMNVDKLNRSRNTL